MILEGWKNSQQASSFPNKEAEKLMQYLQAWWTTLETGLPDLEAVQKPYAGQESNTKRKRGLNICLFEIEELSNDRNSAGDEVIIDYNRSSKKEYYHYKIKTAEQ